MKKNRKSKTGVSAMVSKYKDLPTKNKAQNALLKTGVESVAVITGGYLSAGLGGYWDGKVSLLVGLGLIFGGHIMDDPTNLSQIAGASAIGYGIAKIQEHKALSKTQTVDGLDGAKSKIGEGFSRFTKELLATIGMDKSAEKKEADESVGSIDLSVLDQFEDMNEIQAIQFKQAEEPLDYESELEADLMNVNDEDMQMSGYEEEEEPEYNFAQFEDADLSTI